MSGVSFVSRRAERNAERRCANQFRREVRVWQIRVCGLRWVSLAALALALAGCSQESARFDYASREAQAADFRDDSHILQQSDLRSWRHSGRSDVRSYPEDQRYRGNVTGGLPRENAGHTPMSARSADREDDDRYRGRRRDRHEGRTRRASHTHTVRRGDTLYSISRRYSVNVKSLARVNRLNDPSVIRVGDELIVPTGAEPRHVARRDRRRDAERSGDPRRETSKRRRRAEVREQRPSRDELYVDPLLEERRSRSEPRGRTAGRPRRERSRRDRRDDQTREARRQARISSVPAQRAQSAAQSTPPPKPRRRPEAAEPTQIAKAEVPEGREGSAASAEPARTQTANCRDLMKNPPARSGANFRRPAHGLIVSRFGAQSDGRRNDGINISVPRGTPVKAAENGVVVYAGDELTGLGKLVLVRHADGWVSAYGHNDEILISRCDTVKRGQEIARAGVTGNVTKPQIHFELRKNARPVDPEQHLAGTS